ncbi:MAG: flagellar biosynthesis protein FlgA [Geodermatophilaceae bacterium]|nr:flagellar biosynthesis protein FlgA [Geodermatophilaceae bacterium]
MQSSGTGPGTAGPPGAQGPSIASPAPRRLRAPRWLNFRLIAGVLLVLVSVIIGARVVTAADTSDLVWAAQADLAAGTVLSEGDLRAVSVRLADTGSAYLLSSADPIGRVLSGPVGAGELLPRSILDEPSTLVDIALPVAAGYVPPSLQRGQLVDVYALDATPSGNQPSVSNAPDPSAQPEDSPASDVVTVVVRAAVVQLIAGRADGALSVGSSTVQVVISVDADQAAGIFAAIAGRDLALAVRASVSRPNGADEDGNQPIEGPTPATPTPAAPTPATPTN